MRHGERQRPALQTASVPTGREEAEVRHHEEAGGEQERHSDAELDRAARQARDDPGAFWLDASGLEGLYPSLKEWAGRVREVLRREGFFSSMVVGYSRFGTYALAKSKRGQVVLRSFGDERNAARQVPLEHPLQRVAPPRAGKRRPAPALAVEQQQRHMADAVMTGEGPAFRGADVGDDELQLVVAETADRIPRLADLERSYRNLWKFYVFAGTGNVHVLREVQRATAEVLPEAKNVYRLA